MNDWLPNSILYEINTWTWLHELSLAAGRRVSLADVPGQAWDQLAMQGMNGVWLMGVWERSPAALALARHNRGLHSELRKALPDLRDADLVGSPYSVRRFEVDPQLGGRDGLQAARRALAQRGMRLVLDFVPNHIAPDHAWVTAHPDWFIQGSSEDLHDAPEAFLKVEGRVFARGRDPYFPPWSDVLQLNTFHPELRQAAVAELQRIAAQCDAVRCDMAMLVLNQVFARTWGGRTGNVPDQDYWPGIIRAVKDSYPEFRFIAEAYWDLELTLMSQGFDACYDKGLYDRLASGSAAAVRQHLLRFSACSQRLIHFLENHDEPRAAQVFPGNKGLAAAVVLSTVPGIRLLHDGQLDGRFIRAPIHGSRRPLEQPNDTLHRFYKWLLALAREGVIREGRWTLGDAVPVPNHSSEHSVLCWGWTREAERLLVVVNYSEHSARCQIQPPWDDTAKSGWKLVDLANSVLSAEPNVLDLSLIELAPWEFRLFRANGVPI
jgi:glycosidase